MKNWRDTLQLCREHGGRSDCVLGRYHQGECWDKAEWDRHTPQEPERPVTERGARSMDEVQAEATLRVALTEAARDDVRRRVWVEVDGGNDVRRCDLEVRRGETADAVRLWAHGTEIEWEAGPGETPDEVLAVEHFDPPLELGEFVLPIDALDVFQALAAAQDDRP